MMCSFKCGHLSPYGIDDMIPHLKDSHGLIFKRIERDHVCGLCGVRNTCLTIFEHMKSMHPDDLSTTPINQLVKVVLQEIPENPWKKMKYAECFVKITNTEYMNIEQDVSEKVAESDIEVVDLAESDIEVDDIEESDIEVVDQNKTELDLVLSSSD